MRMTLKQEARYKAYLNELYEQAEVQRKRVEEAKSYGDLAENAEYDSARLELNKTTSKVSAVEEVLSDVEIISVDNNSNKIGIGTVLKLRYEIIPNSPRTLPELEKGKWFEIVESSRIFIPKKNNDDPLELPLKSIVAQELVGQVFSSTNCRFTYRDADNITRTIIIMEIAKG